MMTDTLVARLEAAPGGSRELSDECLLAVGWARGKRQVATIHGIDYTWIRPDGSEQYYGTDAPDPSQNVQDAIDWMVPEGCRWDVQQDRTAAFASIDGETTGRMATPALALSAAGLRAHAALKARQP